MMQIIFDTNIFNAVVDGKAAYTDFVQHELFGTHVQLDELKNTPSDQRREKLIDSFKSADVANVLTESACYDISRYDQAKYASDDLFDQMYLKLVELDRQSNKKSNSDNQKRDILIAETAIKNKLILLSEDCNLRAVIGSFGGRALSLKEYFGCESS